MMRAFFSRNHVRRLFIWLGLLLALLCAGNVLADPPVITTDLPPLLLVSSNTTVIFSVSAVQSNTPSALSFQWRRNGANIPGTLTNFFTNAITTTYKINNVQVTDGGAYSVAIFNADGDADSLVANLIVTNPPFVQGGDNFGNRVVLSGAAFGTSFSIRANNQADTSEPGEPNHGGVKPQKSIWYSWIPPQGQAGVWTIDTRGSDFDTTLSVYSDPGPNVTDVTVLANSGLPTFESDDANYPNNYHNSSVTLNVVAGQTNAIAIDGFYGAKGDVILNMTRQFTIPQPVPTIISQPHSQSVASNSTVTLTFTCNGGFNSYTWYRNGTAINTNLISNGLTNGSLTISNFGVANVGQYQAFISSSAEYTNDGIFTDPASVQIDSVDGGSNPNALALPKFLETTDPGFVPHVHPHIAPVSGFTGTHIWNTYGAEAEPGEPNHCGKVGGAPYWFSYQAPGTGTLTVDANTTTYTNVLAVYTWPGFGDFSQLVSVACASTNNGPGHEVSTFSASSNTTYYLVVDGLAGATGQVTLAYSLITPPVITTQPQSQTVAQGSNVTLNVSATGTPAPAYQWRTNTATYPLQTNTSLTVSNFQSSKEGAYDVVVTNTAGSVTSSVAMLYLNSLRFTNYSLNATGGFSATLLGIASTNYIIQASTNLATTNWQNLSTNSSIYGIIPFADTNYTNYSSRFFRAMKK